MTLSHKTAEYQRIYRLGYNAGRRYQRLRPCSECRMLDRLNRRARAILKAQYINDHGHVPRRFYPLAQFRLVPPDGALASDTLLRGEGSGQ